MHFNPMPLQFIVAFYSVSPYQYLSVEGRCPKWDKCSTRSCASSVMSPVPAIIIQEETTG